MLIAGFPAGPWGANCYIVAASAGAECLVIDPGQDAAPGVADIVREHRLKPVSVLLTHGHVDHMWSVTPVAGAYDAVADAIEQAPAHAPVPVNINWDGSEPHEAVDGDIDHPAIARDRVGPGHPT